MKIVKGPNRSNEEEEALEEIKNLFEGNLMGRESSGFPFQLINEDKALLKGDYSLRLFGMEVPVKAGLRLGSDTVQMRDDGCLTAALRIDLDTSGLTRVNNLQKGFKVVKDLELKLVILMEKDWGEKTEGKASLSLPNLKVRVDVNVGYSRSRGRKGKWGRESLRAETEAPPSPCPFIILDSPEGFKGFPESVFDDREESNISYPRHSVPFSSFSESFEREVGERLTSTYASSTPFGGGVPVEGLSIRKFQRDEKSWSSASPICKFVQKGSSLGGSGVRLGAGDAPRSSISEIRIESSREASWNFPDSDLSLDSISLVDTFLFNELTM